ncbi:hypothetical protein JR316_0006495 [Psilocybe cubensis]|uniref:Uncharacterized protein n=2 Tax=Psilocybe cubensis TaxID=181762 RepID=A0ACB8H2L4_PSICU|nr:hypothetical protein JR316_0006495 [Psilocybe cubensis]KAH9481965.1 hypothetical protein JR316_0006495 [Psilocybe cubensis]
MSYVGFGYAIQQEINVPTVLQYLAKSLGPVTSEESLPLAFNATFIKILELRYAPTSTTHKKSVSSYKKLWWTGTERSGVAGDIIDDNCIEECLEYHRKQQQHNMQQQERLRLDNTPSPMAPSPKPSPKTSLPKTPSPKTPSLTNMPNVLGPCAARYRPKEWKPTMISDWSVSTEDTPSPDKNRGPFPPIQNTSPTLGPRLHNQESVDTCTPLTGSLYDNVAALYNNVAPSNDEEAEETSPDPHLSPYNEISSLYGQLDDPYNEIASLYGELDAPYNEIPSTDGELDAEDVGDEEAGETLPEPHLSPYNEVANLYNQLDAPYNEIASLYVELDATYNEIPSTDGEPDAEDVGDEEAGETLPEPHLSPYNEVANLYNQLGAPYNEIASLYGELDATYNEITNIHGKSDAADVGDELADIFANISPPTRAGANVAPPPMTAPPRTRSIVKEVEVLFRGFKIPSPKSIAQQRPPRPDNYDTITLTLPNIPEPFFYPHLYDD